MSKLAMKLMEALFSVHRRICLYFREGSVRTYAVEVEADFVDNFVLPGAEICDQWQGENGSTIFIAQSNKELRDISQIVKGVIGVTRM